MVNSIQGISEKNVAILQSKLKEAKDEQGIIGTIWNGVKEITTLGQSYSDCEKMARKYEKGEISIDEAIEYIEQFKEKQGTMTELISNTATGAVAIAATTAAVASGPIGWGVALANGAAIGAATKTGINFFDRATNGVDNDALDLKLIAKDAVSGAVTGTMSAVSGSATSKLGGLVKNDNLRNIVMSAECGAKCGVMSEAINYTFDCALDKDKDFSFGELTARSLTSGAISTVTGGLVGSAFNHVNLTNTLVRDEVASASKKIGGRVIKDVVAV